MGWIRNSNKGSSTYNLKVKDIVSRQSNDVYRTYGVSYTHGRDLSGTQTLVRTFATTRRK